MRPHEQKNLLRLKRQRPNTVNSRHARVIPLSRGGLSNCTIAHRADCTPQWVRTLLHRFNDDGLDGITWPLFHQTRGTPRRRLAAGSESEPEERARLMERRDENVSAQLLPPFDPTGRLLLSGGGKGTRIYCDIIGPRLLAPVFDTKSVPAVLTDGQWSGASFVDA